MPKRIFEISEGGQTTTITLTWKIFWQKFTALINGNPLGTIPSLKELRKGKDFILKSGSTLHIQLVRKSLNTELQVLLNGTPIAASDSHPIARLKLAYQIVFFLSGLNFCVGLIGLVSPTFMRLGFGIYNLILAAFYLIAGIGIKRLSYVALALAIAIFAGDTVMALIQSIRLKMNPVGWIVVRIMLFMPLIRAIRAVELLKSSQDPSE